MDSGGSASCNGALGAESYDEQWRRLGDFVRYNPGCRHRRRLLRQAIADVGFEQGRVLDIGCGLGETVSFLREELPSATFTGVDFSPHAIDACRSRFPFASWELLDVSAGYLSREFDLIICSEVLEHLENPLSALRNMRNMLVQGGALIVTVPHGMIHETERRFGHLFHPGIDELQDWIRRAGFVVESCKVWGWPGYSLLKRMANVRPDAAVRTFGNGSYGPLARAVNAVAYVGTGVFSTANSSRGVQTVLAARG